ncbi:hypothetical protein K402DRAFT_446212 [Aulographum hederae CBS 113979]|uniref:Uncharacterized protein n=1 Tax=Aulographum hederae CBS 113979 TaxID=1176131 RepID=A0A6G1H1W1_9PEZI|nr:hypothetical protein K402DRAFT_446212 [Aulographum hederae CBS 113979]
MNVALPLSQESQPDVIIPDTQPNSLAPSADPLSRGKYNSPAPIISNSMTPPPSTQVAQAGRATMRTPTPPGASVLLSSPPPTGKVSVSLGTTNWNSAMDLPTGEQVSSASPDDLRATVMALTTALREARASTASLKLQYNMLCIESAESANRMAVELDMTQREVDVLQAAEERRRAENVVPPQNPTFQQDTSATANATLVHDMSRHCSMLQSENEELRDVLAQSKRVVEAREGQITTLVEENERLRNRIKKNREHMNGFLDFVNENSPVSILHSFPNQHPRFRNPTGIRTGGPDISGPPAHHTNRSDQQPFEALLLADKVLSQETATAPSTPVRSQPSGMQKPRFGHSRGTHSMSSLPSTPQRRAAAISNTHRTPPSFAPINEVSVPRSAPQVRYCREAPAPPAPPHRRRGSSDSTITASSVDSREDKSRRRDLDAADDDEVPESSASQAATSMLRRTPQLKSASSSQVSASGGRAGGGELTQTKLYGQVKKAGVGPAAAGKKRSAEEMGGAAGKRRREEGVGLGIGLVGSPR